MDEFLTLLAVHCLPPSFCRTEAHTYLGKLFVSTEPYFGCHQSREDCVKPGILLAEHPPLPFEAIRWLSVASKVRAISFAPCAIATWRYRRSTPAFSQFPRVRVPRCRAVWTPFGNRAAVGQSPCPARSGRRRASSWGFPYLLRFGWAFRHPRSFAPCARRVCGNALAPD